MRGKACEFSYVINGERERTTLLTHVLHTCALNDTCMRVKVESGSWQMTNWRTLRRKYGESSIKVTTRRGGVTCMRLRQLRASMLLLAEKKGQHRQVQLIRIVKVRTSDAVLPVRPVQLT